jgi:hydrogenase nickel incorporation protein HypA/HybF
MHEYSVASEIAAIVKQTAGESRVRKITVAVGALSGIFTESLLMYLDLVLPEMGMSGAAIEIKEISATFACTCGTEYQTGSIADGCPRCGEFARTIKSGHDCTVESIEVEDD